MVRRSRRASGRRTRRHSRHSMKSRRVRRMRHTRARGRAMKRGGMFRGTRDTVGNVPGSQLGSNASLWTQEQQNAYDYDKYLRDSAGLGA